MFREIKKISNNILFINLGILGLVTFIIIIYLALSNYIHDMSFFSFIGSIIIHKKIIPLSQKTISPILKPLSLSLIKNNRFDFQSFKFSVIYI